MKEFFRFMGVIVLALVATTIIAVVILGAYACFLNRVVQDSPTKTSIVTQKGYEFRGTTITGAPGNNVGVPAVGVTSAKLYAKLILKNGDYVRVSSEEDTISIGDTITYKAFMIIDVKKKNNNQSQDKS